LKAVEKWGVGGKGIREHTGRGWIDQRKAHPQCGYNETSLWTSTYILIMKNRTVK
jgi:hypothetical protein